MAVAGGWWTGDISRFARPVPIGGNPADLKEAQAQGSIDPAERSVRARIARRANAQKSNPDVRDWPCAKRNLNDHQRPISRGATRSGRCPDQRQVGCGWRQTPTPTACRSKTAKGQNPLGAVETRFRPGRAARPASAEGIGTSREASGPACRARSIPARRAVDRPAMSGDSRRGECARRRIGR